MKPGAILRDDRDLAALLAERPRLGERLLRVSVPTTISRSFMTGTGLKKWRPMNRSGREVAAAIWVIEIDDVFEAKRAPASRLSRARKSRASPGGLGDRLDHDVAVLEGLEPDRPLMRFQAASRSSGESFFRSTPVSMLFFTRASPCRGGPGPPRDDDLHARARADLDDPRPHEPAATTPTFFQFCATTYPLLLRFLQSCSRPCLAPCLVLSFSARPGHSRTSSMAMPMPPATETAARARAGPAPAHLVDERDDEPRPAAPEVRRARSRPVDVEALGSSPSSSAQRRPGRRRPRRARRGRSRRASPPRA